MLIIDLSWHKIHHLFILVFASVVNALKHRNIQNFLGNKRIHYYRSREIKLHFLKCVLQLILLFVLSPLLK